MSKPASRILLRAFTRLLCLVTFGLLATVAAQAADTGTKTFNLPAGAAEKTLKQFTTQSGVQLVYPTDLVKGVRTNAVAGDLAPIEALEKMVAGTPLVVMKDATPGAFAIKRAANTAEAEKNAPSRPASDRAASDEDRGVIKLDTFEVMGTKLLNMDIRRSVDDAQPYVIFNRDRIIESGALDLGDFFKQRLTMNTVGQASGQGTTAFRGLSAINLRGLGTNQTLILIDGRRIAAPATQGLPLQSDLGTIPLAAIERVEVLPTTSSGIYGGSATGGVINVILRRDFRGAEIRATYDNSFDSDTSVRRVELGMGFSLPDGKTNMMLTGAYSETNPLAQADRDFYDRGIARVLANNPSFLLNATTPPIGATANIRSTNGSNLTLKTGAALNSPITFAPYGYLGGPSDGGAGLVANAGRYNFDLANTAQNGGGGRWIILSGARTASAGGTIRRDFTSRLSAYVDAAFSQSRQRDLTSFTATVALPVTAASNPFNQAITVRVPVPVGDRWGGFFNQNWRLSGGVIAKLPKDWMAAADYTWNKTRLKSFSQSRSLTAAGTAALAAANPDPLRDPALTTFDPSLLINTQEFDPFSTQLLDATLRVSGPLFKFSAGDLTLSSSVESRRETFQSGSLLNIGATATYPERSQKNDSGYLETYVPLVSPALGLSLIQELGVQLAVRHDRYEVHATNIVNAATPVANPVSNDSQSTNPTVAVKYSPLKGIMIRASYGTGFLSPSVNQLSPITQSINIAPHLIDPRRGNETFGTYLFTSSGNPNLKPERSESWSVGVVVDPPSVAGLRVSLDFTRIHKTDNIVSLTQQQVLNNEALFPDRIGRAATAPGDPFGVGPVNSINTTAINAADTLLETYDGTIGYNWKWGSRKFSVYCAATYVVTHRTQILAGQLATDNIGKAGVINPGVQLRWKGNAGATCQSGPWIFGWNARYFDSYLAADPAVTTNTTTLRNQGGDGSIPSQIYHDVFARYDFSRNGRPASWLGGFEAQVGLRNVFNQAIPFDASNTNSYYSYFGDPRGRTYYVSLKRTF